MYSTVFIRYCDYKLVKQSYIVTLFPILDTKCQFVLRNLNIALQSNSLIGSLDNGSIWLLVQASARQILVLK